MAVGSGRLLAALVLTVVACGGARTSARSRGAASGKATSSSNVSMLPLTALEPRASATSTKDTEGWDCTRVLPQRPALPEPIEAPEFALNTLEAGLAKAGPTADVRVCSHVEQWVLPDASGCTRANIALAGALELRDVRQRDRALAGLVACSVFAPGVISALRAEFDMACGDVIAQSALKKSRGDEAPDTRAALVALAYASRLARNRLALPRFTGESDEKNLEHYRTKVLRPWLQAESARIEPSDAQLKKLGDYSYARAIGAMAVALAWTRVHGTVRSNPIPDTMKRLYEQRTRYYGMLDDELSYVMQLKVRADTEAAALVSRYGIRHSPLADAWYKGVAGSWNQGAAANQLHMPRPPGCAASSTAARLASQIPSFYAGLFVARSEATQPCVVAGLIEQGLSIAHRRAWRDTPPGADVASLLALGSFAVARRSFDPVYFDESVRQLARVREQRHALTADEELLLATSCAARGVSWVLSARPNEAHPRATEAAVRPLLQYAQSSAPKANRALALLNAAQLLRMGAPEVAERSYGLYHQAKDLAIGTPAQPCVENSADSFGEYQNWARFRTAKGACVMAEPL